MSLKDVPTPARVGDEIPCERCKNIGMPENVYNFFLSFKSGHVSEEEFRAVMHAAAQDCRLHRECAEYYIDFLAKKYMTAKR